MREMWTCMSVTVLGSRRVYSAPWFDRTVRGLRRLVRSLLGGRGLAKNPSLGYSISTCAPDSNSVTSPERASVLSAKTFMSRALFFLPFGCELYGSCLCCYELFVFAKRKRNICDAVATIICATHQDQGHLFIKRK